MALVTIQRSPTPSTSPEDQYDLDSNECVCSSAGEAAGGEPGSQKSPRFLSKNRSLSEYYFAVKGAAVILPQNDSIMIPRNLGSTGGGEIQLHLTAMLHLLRPQDTLKMAVRLESVIGHKTRYMAIVCTMGRQDNQESVILGIDYVSPEQTTLGLVLPIWASTVIALEGDGSISVKSSSCDQLESQHIFKPVSVQAMWSAFQSLHKEQETARSASNAYYPGGWTHTWVCYYSSKINSPENYRAEWHYMMPIDDSLQPPSSLDRYRAKPLERAGTEKLIRVKLKDIMQSVDLDEVTSKDIRGKLEESLSFELSEYKEFIDNEMLVILGQMDKPSQIFPYLYLGTEWNASNWEELRQNKVGHIVNVTKEVDNFFPGLFDYMKIPVSDEASSELLKHWDVSYKFICKAKEKNCGVLVHCKKGISRSSSTVIAYAMKAYGLSVDDALEYVKEKRNCITPNRGFMEQLRTYQGILDASRNRNNALWNQTHPARPLPRTVQEHIDEDETNDEVIYTMRHEEGAVEMPALVATASGNILKSGPASTCSLSDPTNPEVEDKTIHRWGEGIDDSLFALNFGPVRPEVDEDELAYSRPSVERHLRTIGEKLKDPDQCPLKQVQEVLMRKRPMSGGNNQSSSSGASCSESSSLASYSGEEDIPSNFNNDNLRRSVRSKSKSSSGGSTGDSAIGELGTSPPRIPEVPHDRGNLDGRKTSSNSDLPLLAQRESPSRLSLPFLPKHEREKHSADPAQTDQTHRKHRFWRSFHVRGDKESPGKDLRGGNGTEWLTKWYSPWPASNRPKSADTEQSFRNETAEAQNWWKGRQKLSTGTVQSRKAKLEQLSGPEIPAPQVNKVAVFEKAPLDIHEKIAALEERKIISSNTPPIPESSEGSGSIRRNPASDDNLVRSLVGVFELNKRGDKTMNSDKKIGDSKSCGDSAIFQLEFAEIEGSEILEIVSNEEERVVIPSSQNPIPQSNFQQRPMLSHSIPLAVHSTYNPS